MSIYTSTFENNRAREGVGGWRGRGEGGFIHVKGAPLVMDGCVARNNSARVRGHFLTTEPNAWATLELTNVTMSGPKDKMEGNLIDLGSGSETNSAYTSITLDGCSVEGAGAKSNTIKAGAGAIAIYRNDELTTDPAERREDVSYCDASASFRWVHAARLLVCICGAGKYRSQEEACADLECKSTQPLLCSACPAG
jgi:hypothetical protein